MAEREPISPATAVGPPPVPPPGPIAQSVAIGFRAVYVAALLLVLVWLASNIREIPSDSQAVVSRFGRIVRSQDAGLLLAWPTPIEQVRLLPGPERQLSQDVAALPAPDDKYQTLIGASQPGIPGGGAIPANVGAYLTGDGNVVLLNANLIYHISDPIAYALSETHVPAALNRLFRATTVHVTAGRNVNDFLVTQTTDEQDGGQSIGALRAEVRDSLLKLLNDRLDELAKAGASLGVHIERIDWTANVPPDAKSAFDAVLVAIQAADRGVAVASRDAEIRRQAAVRQSQTLVSAAQASAKEIVSKANVETARIVALEQEETPQTHESLLMREYREMIGQIVNRTGPITVIDPHSGVRFVLAGNEPGNERQNRLGNPPPPASPAGSGESAGSEEE
ncbi:MAG TPA: SPFH domain-containing protein [Gammaproteobacteria bacterium]|nr:SPFH domain-containing protein [Gammaproteobacteria bacterium]